MLVQEKFNIKQSWINNIQWQYIIVYSVIISAIVPKIIIADGVNLFLPELVVFSGLILGIRQFITFQEQQLILGIFLSILFFSIIIQLSITDIGAVLRSIKEILYISIIYWASLINNKKQVMKHLVFFGCIAFLLNILLYTQSYAAENTIWSGSESLSSGISNRGFFFPSLNLVQLPGLAHGIWGSYCVLIFVITLSLRKEKLISIWLFMTSLILFITNMLITISRESLLLLLVIAIISFFKSGITIVQRFIIISGITFSVYAIAIFGSTLPVVQKITYTYTSLTETKSEGNLTLRINTWAAYFNLIAHRSEYLIEGLGLSPDNFYQHISHYTHENIVDVPESVLVYTQAYGGIISFSCFIMLVITAGYRLNKRSPYKLLKYYFIGLLITNSMSSVSMFSDLLYAHICLIYGLLIVKKNEI